MYAKGISDASLSISALSGNIWIKPILKKIPAEKEFERLLWKEQGKIWNKDSEKYNLERKMIDEKIKKMNLKNAEMLKEQIKNKKEENIRKNGMSLIEYTLNKNVLNKVMDSMEDEKNKQS